MTQQGPAQERECRCIRTEQFTESDRLGRTKRSPRLLRERSRARNSGFEITSFGRLVLEGKEDHVRVNGINRWLGGVHLIDGAPMWRWDEAAQTVRP